MTERFVTPSFIRFAARAQRVLDLSRMQPETSPTLLGAPAEPRRTGKGKIAASLLLLAGAAYVGRVTAGGFMTPESLGRDSTPKLLQLLYTRIIRVSYAYNKIIISITVIIVILRFAILL